MTKNWKKCYFSALPRCWGPIHWALFSGRGPLKWHKSWKHLQFPSLETRGGYEAQLYNQKHMIQIPMQVASDIERCFHIIVSSSWKYSCLSDCEPCATSSYFQDFLPSSGNLWVPTCSYHARAICFFSPPSRLSTLLAVLKPARRKQPAVDQKWSEMVKKCYRSYRSSSTFNSRIRMKTPPQVLFILFNKHRLQLSKVKETQLLGEISVLLLINVDYDMIYHNIIYYLDLSGLSGLYYINVDLSGMLSSKDSIPLAWLPLTFPRDFQTLLEEFPP